MTLHHYVSPARPAGPAGVTATQRRRAVAVVLAVLALLVTGCSTPEPPKETKVAVTGPAGTMPTLRFVAPISLPQERTQVVWPGAGEVLVKSGHVLLNMYAQDGRNHDVLQNTYGTNPQWITLDDATAGPGLTAALVGQRAGARILYFEQDKKVPVVLVVDVLSTRAGGEKVTPDPGIPKVTVPDAADPVVEVPAGAAPPDDLVVQPLIRGTGSQVAAGNRITVRYTGARWSTGAAFDSNWDTQPVTITIGVGSVMAGWDQGLLEQTVGSRVELVVPPDLGYQGTTSELADETLIFVVDILDAQVPVKAGETPAPTGSPVPAASTEPGTSTIPSTAPSAKE